MVKFESEKLGRIYKRIVGAMSGFKEIEVEVKTNAIPHFDGGNDKIVMPDVISYAKNDEEDFVLGRGIMVHEVGHLLFAPSFTNDEIKAIENSRIAVKEYAEFFNVFADCNNEAKVAALWTHLRPTLKLKTEKIFEKKPQLRKKNNPWHQLNMRCDTIYDSVPDYPKDMHPLLKDFIEKIAKQFKENRMEFATGDQLKSFTFETAMGWQKVKDKWNEQQQEVSDQAKEIMKQMAAAIRNGNTALEKQLADKLKKATSKKPLYEDAPSLSKGKPSMEKDPNSQDLSNMTMDQLKDKQKQTDAQQLVSGRKGFEPDEYTIEQRTPEDREIEFDLKDAFKRGKRIHRQLKKKVELENSFESKHKSGTPDIDIIRKQVAKAKQITNPEIFKRKNTFARGGEWAVSVLVDLSSSMDGDRIQNAKEALATFAYAFDGLPNVKYELVGFCSGMQDVSEIRIKDYKHKRLKTQNLTQLFASGGTPLNPIMQEASKRMRPFHHMKRVIIVITDGEPAKYEECKETIKIIENSQHTKVIGIGVGEDYDTEKLEDLFKINHQFKDSDRLPIELTAILLNVLNNKTKFNNFGVQRQIKFR